MKENIPLITLVVLVLIGICIFFFSIYEPYQCDTVESARRIVCENNQKNIYLALKDYKNNHGTLPENLETLVQENYISQDNLLCPALPKDPNIRHYIYMPDNFGDENLPIISENYINHSSFNVKIKKIKPVVIQTMGDGNVIQIDTTNMSPLK
jgi:hypothetical protein